MLSPIRFGQRKFRAGGTNGSVFSLIAATLGSGTISFSYLVMENGYILGPILIALGAALSYYTGMLIVRCSEETGRTRYEDIALAIYGKRVARVTSFLNLICLMGFTFSYIVYVKKAVPCIVELYSNDIQSIPEWLRNTGIGRLFWGLAFSFLILLPMSIPRSVNALRFTSLFGVLCSMYLCIAVTLVFFSDSKMVPIPSANLKKIEAFKFSLSGFVKTFPLIIFAYMYQVNIPMIYRELNNRNTKRMARVISTGSGVAVLFYIMVGIFGYATFVNNPDELESKNIL